MTILELKTAAASYVGRTVADLTVNGQDLALLALNQVRLNAELLHDFNFQRKLLTLNVNSVTGGSLDDAVLYGTSTTASVKTVIDLGQFDDFGNLRPVDWTTTEDGLERQREDNPFSGVRYPSDGDAVSSPWGGRRFALTGNNVYSFPKSETSETLPIGIEAYVFSSDWTTASNTVTVSGGDAGTNGIFRRYGIYNSKTLFINGNLYVLWFNTTQWVISYFDGLGGSPTTFYSLTSTSESPAGTYTAHGTWSGSPVATSAEADTTSDIWTTHGQQYLLWGTVVHLNQLFKEFVQRQEGNLPPPQALADQGLQNLITWDIYRYEQFRRH